jgi:hypothetical protein
MEPLDPLMLVLPRPEMQALNPLLAIASKLYSAGLLAQPKEQSVAGRGV